MTMICLCCYFFEIFRQAIWSWWECWSEVRTMRGTNESGGSDDVIFGSLPWVSSKGFCRCPKSTWIFGRYENSSNRGRDQHRGVRKHAFWEAWLLVQLHWLDLILSGWIICNHHPGRGCYILLLCLHLQFFVHSSKSIGTCWWQWRQEISRQVQKGRGWSGHVTSQRMNVDGGCTY